MRVVLFVPLLTRAPHGVAKVSDYLADFLRRWRVTLDVVESPSAHNLSDVGRRQAIKSIRFLMFLARGWMRCCRAPRADVSYLPFAPAWPTCLRDALVAWLGKHRATRTIIHVHGEGLEHLLHSSLWRHRMVRYLLRGTEVIVIPRALAQRIKKYKFFKSVWCVPNVSFETSAPFRRVSDKPLVLCYMANLDPRKGVYIFQQIVSRLAKKGLNVTAHLAGGSTPFLTVETLRHHLDGTGIRVHGFVSGAVRRSLLRRADVFVYPSRHDHVPLSLIDAMAAGAVPLTLDQGGIAELVGKELSRNVFNKNDADDDIIERMAARIMEYARHPARLDRDRRHTLRQQRGHFTPVHAERAFRACFFDVGNQGRRRVARRKKISRSRSPA